MAAILLGLGVISLVVAIWYCVGWFIGVENNTMDRIGMGALTSMFFMLFIAACWGIGTGLLEIYASL